MRKHTVFSFFSIFLPCLAMTPVLAAQELTLASSGKTAYTIVYPDGATATERMAARELSEYLQKVTDASFPIAAENDSMKGPLILLGSSHRSRSLLGQDAIAALGGQEFIIKTTAQDILLVGGRPLGTLYAVYSFLETDVGCHWLSVYGDEQAPHKPTLTIGAINRHEKPAFAVRDYFMFFGNNKNIKWNDRFMYRNRAIGPRLMLEYNRGAYDFTKDLAKTYPYRYLNGFGHTFFSLINPKQYFQNHPEYFSMIGGERKPRQLCFSSADLRHALTAQIEKEIQAKGMAKGTIIHLGAQDDYTRWCECPDCTALAKKEGTPGASLFAYMAELGRRLESEHPGIYVSTLAYRESQTEIPPATIKFPDNVIICLAPIDMNFAAPIEDASNKNLLDHLEAWSKKVKHLWIWYYPNPYGNGYLPIGNLQKMAKDFQLFHRLGVEGFFLEHDSGITYSHLFTDLQTWLLAKLMWNPDQNLDDLIKEYTDIYYGAAAPSIRRYITMLDDATGAMKTRLTWHASPKDYRYLTPQLISNAQTLLQKAVDAVADEPQLKLRVEQVRMSLDRATLLFWPRMQTLPDFHLNRQDIKARYQKVWQETVAQRFRPDLQKRENDRLENWLKTVDAKTAAKHQSLPIVNVPATPPLAGDPARADWSKGIALGPLHELSGKPVKIQADIRLLHDREYLYVRLQENVDTNNLVNSTWAGDLWEMFVAPSREAANASAQAKPIPYRQVAVTPGDHFTFCYSAYHKQSDDVWKKTVRIVSKDAKSQWTVYLSIPLQELVPGGLKPFMRFYANFYRTKPKIGKFSWVPNFDGDFHRLDQLGEFKLD